MIYLNGVHNLAWSFPGGSVVKNLRAMWEIRVPFLDKKDILKKGMAIHSTCLENSMDRGAWRATIHGVTKSQTQLSN